MLTPRLLKRSGHSRPKENGAQLFPGHPSEYDGELTQLLEQVNRSAKKFKTDDVKALDNLLTVATEHRAPDLLLVANSHAPGAGTASGQGTFGGRINNFGVMFGDYIDSKCLARLSSVCCR